MLLAGASVLLHVARRWRRPRPNKPQPEDSAKPPERAQCSCYCSYFATQPTAGTYANCLASSPSFTSRNCRKTRTCCRQVLFPILQSHLVPRVSVDHPRSGFCGLPVAFSSANCKSDADHYFRVVVYVEAYNRCRSSSCTPMCT